MGKNWDAVRRVERWWDRRIRDYLVVFFWRGIGFGKKNTLIVRPAPEADPEAPHYADSPLQRRRGPDGEPVCIRTSVPLFTSIHKIHNTFPLVFVRISKFSVPCATIKEECAKFSPKLFSGIQGVLQKNLPRIFFERTFVV